MKSGEKWVLNCKAITDNIYMQEHQKYECLEFVTILVSVLWTDIQYFIFIAVTGDTTKYCQHCGFYLSKNGQSLAKWGTDSNDFLAKNLSIMLKRHAERRPELRQNCTLHMLDAVANPPRGQGPEFASASTKPEEECESGSRDQKNWAETCKLCVEHAKRARVGVGWAFPIACAHPWW